MEGFAEDLDVFFPVGQAAAQRIRRLPTDDQDRIERIFDVVAQVVQDAPGFRHTRGRDDHHRVFAVIQRLRFLDRAGVHQAVKTQRRAMLVMADKFLSLGIKALFVLFKNIGRIHGQRAVHIHRHGGDFMILDHLVQVVDQLLRAPNGKGRDDHLAAAVQGLRDHLAQLIIGHLRVAVRLVAVGAFHEHVIGMRRQHGVAQQRQIAPPNIPRKPQADLAALFLDLQRQRSRTQDMAGIHQASHHPRKRLERLIVIHALEVLRHLGGIFLGIKRINHRQP